MSAATSGTLREWSRISLRSSWLHRSDRPANTAFGSRPYQLIDLRLRGEALGPDTIHAPEHEVLLDALLDGLTHERRRLVLLVQGFKARSRFTAAPNTV
jgi:hypothetical protein